MGQMRFVCFKTSWICLIAKIQEISNQAIKQLTMSQPLFIPKYVILEIYPLLAPGQIFQLGSSRNRLTRQTISAVQGHDKFGQMRLITLIVSPSSRIISNTLCRAVRYVMLLFKLKHSWQREIRGILQFTKFTQVNYTLLDHSLFRQIFSKIVMQRITLLVIIISSHQLVCHGTETKGFGPGTGPRP